MNWKLFDEIFASIARPIGTTACGLAIAFSVVWAAIFAHDIFFVAAGAAATVYTGYAVTRTLDKRAALGAATGATPPKQDTA